MGGDAKGDGRQSRWDRHNKTRRQHILDAATAVLAESEPGAEVHVQQIADRAGLGRSVVYRHFADRADLDAAVQGQVLEMLRGALVPALSFDGTPIDIIRRIVSTYVGWAAENESLHMFAQQDQAGPGAGQMDQAIQQIAGQVEGLINAGVELLHVRLDEAEVAALDPLVFGLVGGVFSSTRRWLALPGHRPAREPFVELVTEAVWLQIAGIVRARGVELDPDVPVEALFDPALNVTG